MECQTSPPVALPGTFTLAAALGSVELSKRGVLITRLSALHDIASMTVLCSDKTGTLTRNRFSGGQFGFGPGRHRPPRAGRHPHARAWSGLALGRNGRRARLLRLRGLAQSVAFRPSEPALSHGRRPQRQGTEETAGAAKNQIYQCECLDHVMVLNARPLSQLLADYVDYYHRHRPYRPLEQDRPDPRRTEPPEKG
jgi:hypothetical protein